MNRFLNNQQMASLVEAIRVAEAYSTGEIHIHIDSGASRDNARRAYEVFNRLCKGKTKDKNAVLFHVNFQYRYLTIIGDEGIHRMVCQSFWDILHDDITKAFAHKNYYQGLRDALLKTGLQLKKYFPADGENTNELPDEISFS